MDDPTATFRSRASAAVDALCTALGGVDNRVCAAPTSADGVWDVDLAVGSASFRVLWDPERGYGYWTDADPHFGQTPDLWVPEDRPGEVSAALQGIHGLGSAAGAFPDYLGWG